MKDWSKYEPLFNAWYVKRTIGSGSFGKVYEIEREEFGRTYKAALKVISVPQEESEIKKMRLDGSTDVSIKKYFDGLVEDIVSEYVFMSELKGNSNVVSYEDHMIIPKEGGIGCDILIRMELLTPLIDHMIENSLTEQEVIRLGIEICKALELCHKNNIIHRDVKPENIFISKNGDFKLGDFGIARSMEANAGSLSKKGTYTYMAPEVYKGDSYGISVDVYSLGIVMYSLLNGNRGPFLPAPPAEITHNDREAALIRRVKGESLPLPANCSEALGELILKACAYDTEKRFPNAKAMRTALERMQFAKGEDNYDSTSGLIDKTVLLDETAMSDTGSVSEPTMYLPEQNSERPKEYHEHKTGRNGSGNNRSLKANKKTLMVGGIAAVLIVLAIIVFAFVLPGKAGGVLDDDQTDKISITSWDWNWGGSKPGDGVVTVDIIMDVENNSDHDISGIAFTAKDCEGNTINNQQTTLYERDAPFYAEGFVKAGGKGVMISQACVTSYVHEISVQKHKTEDGDDANSDMPNTADSKVVQAYEWAGDENYIVPHGEITDSHKENGGTYDVVMTNDNEEDINCDEVSIVTGYHDTGSNGEIKDGYVGGKLSHDIDAGETEEYDNVFVDPGFFNYSTDKVYFVYAIEKLYDDGTPVRKTYDDNFEVQ